MPANEHAAHHPDGQPAKGEAPKGQGAQKSSPGMGGMSGMSGGTGSGASGMGGMMAGMDKMMEGMHRPPRKELYPSLMELPDVPSERQAELARRAAERVRTAAGQMSAALARLQSARPEDGAARQQALSQLREALAQYENGLAAERALQPGGTPRAVALDWFKREMNLPTASHAGASRGPAGLPMGVFHGVALLILGSFAGAMVWIYLQRMRRAAELLAGLVGSGSAVPTATTAPAAVAAPPTTTGSWSGALRVARIFDETADVKTFRLALPEGADALPFTFQPGQFLTVSVNVDGKVVKRSYSIASSPCCQGWCELTVKHAPGGLVSGYLHERIREGDLLNVSGPYGRFTFRGQEAPDVVFIAGGVGITPLMSSIRFLTDQSWPGEIFLIYACVRLDDVIFREELEYLRRRHPKLHLTLSLSKEDSPAWAGPRGHVTKELLQSAVPDLARRRVHLCGPPPMIEAVKALLSELRVPPEQVKTELFLSPEPRRVPAPGTEVTAGEPDTQAAVCTFARSRKSAPLPPDRTVLEAAEGIGVDIDHSCRQGYCGICKIRLLSGQVAMEVTDGLTPAEQESNIILACQAKATADVVVDA